MKKLFSILILAAMIGAMFAVPSFAMTPKKLEAAYGTPKLDGRMDDAYLESTEITVDVVYDEANQTWPGGNIGNAVGKARCLWDDGYLYVYFEVQDAVRSEARSNVGVYRTDSTEVIIDLPNAQDGQETINSDAGQFTAGYLETDMAGYGYWYEMYGDSAKFFVRDIDGGYAVEYQIPFGTEYSPMEAGKTIGIVFAINDDADGKEGREYIVYGNEDQLGSWNKTVNYDQLTLIEGSGNHTPNTPDTDDSKVTTDDKQGDVTTPEVTTDNNNGGTTEDPKDTGSDEPKVTTDSKGDTTTENKDNNADNSGDNSDEKKSGCGSVVFSSSAALVALCAVIPAAFVQKKKKH